MLWKSEIRSWKVQIFVFTLKLRKLSEYILKSLMTRIQCERNPKLFNKNLHESKYSNVTEIKRRIPENATKDNTGWPINKKHCTGICGSFEINTIKAWWSFNYLQLKDRELNWTITTYQIKTTQYITNGFIRMKENYVKVIKLCFITFTRNSFSPKIWYGLCYRYGNEPTATTDIKCKMS